MPTTVVILQQKIPLQRGPKAPQMCTIVDDCARIAESGLKPPFESPHVDFLDYVPSTFFVNFDFSRTFWTPGPGGPGRLGLSLSGFWPEGPEIPSGARGERIQF